VSHNHQHATAVTGNFQNYVLVFCDFGPW